MATVSITTQAQREFLEDVEEHLRKLKRLRKELAKDEADTAAKLAVRDAFGDKIRRLIVREFPAADGALEAQLEDFLIVRDGEGVITEIRTNADA